MKTVLILLSLVFSSYVFAGTLGEDIKNIRSKTLVEFYQHIYDIDPGIYHGEIVKRDSCLGDPTLAVTLHTLEQVRQNEAWSFSNESYSASSYPESYVDANFSLLREFNQNRPLTALSGFFAKNIENNFSQSGVLRIYHVLDSENDKYLPRVVDQGTFRTILLLDVTTAEVIEATVYQGGSRDCD